MQELVIIGDSFCHGVGTVTPFKNTENTQFAFGRYLADYLGLRYVNLAEPGSTVLRTAEVGFNYLRKNTNVHTVIAGWTFGHRFGLYSDQSVLQILPQYALLGDPEDDRVEVEYKDKVKFITDQSNKHHLSMLPELYQVMVENNFFESQHSVSTMVATCFQSWAKEQDFRYIDFNVFGNPNIKTTSGVTFLDVMNPINHPTKEEQEAFANLFIKSL